MGDDKAALEALHELWSRLQRADAPCLALDYDGTLAPFRVERMTARPLPGVTERIAKIRDDGRTALAIISGRPLDELLELLGDLRVPLIGSHGFERREPDGRRQVAPLAAAQRAALEQAEDMLRAQGVAAEQIERKAGSVALHTRGLADAAELERQVTAQWQRLSGQAVHCRGFDGGVELRADGPNKGTVLGRWLDDFPDCDLAVYLGDDETDEDAFRVLRQHPRGFGILVRAEPRPSAAHGRLPDCAAVRGFLDKWVEHGTRRSAPAPSR